MRIVLRYRPIEPESAVNVLIGVTLFLVLANFPTVGSSMLSQPTPESLALRPTVPLILATAGGPGSNRIEAARDTSDVRRARCSPLNTQQLNDLVTTVANRHDIGAGLLRAMVRKESAGHPCAVSKKGARGILQLMPATARAMGVH